MQSDTYTVHRGGDNILSCIDLVESTDDGGWYAEEYDFTRADNATRTSHKIFQTRAALVKSLDTGKHKWTMWGKS